MRLIALVSFALIIAAPSRADNLTPQQITAFNNLQEEFTTCGVYYRIEIACATSEWKQKLEIQLEPTLKVFDVMVISIGSKIGMTKDAIEQRLRRVAAEQSRITNSSTCVNIDSLYARHDLRCKQLAEHPEAILDEYMRK